VDPLSRAAWTAGDGARAVSKFDLNAEYSPANSGMQMRTRRRLQSGRLGTLSAPRALAPRT